MKSTNLGRGAIRSALLGIIAAVLAHATGCHGVQKRVTGAPELAPFVELSRGATCSDKRNRLFVIDQALVFRDRAGNHCPDYSYSEVLYGKTVNDMLCSSNDSIAGRRTNCKDSRFKDYSIPSSRTSTRQTWVLVPTTWCSRFLFERRRRCVCERMGVSRNGRGINSRKKAWSPVYAETVESEVRPLHVNTGEPFCRTNSVRAL
jgi:hypothetical protein